ncbi:hypothetical protein BSL78_20659 [Apostichopus japonicus]|uniref:Reverse transcriptase domain-containing protein n=1 Tax=Stichopus japonicus TaxID=307972 RepID=A0A2G8K3A5_STIJA|nr:hypothetical protein BSL78_20659 [Apostichopus japonicus]
MHETLIHLERKCSYARVLFIDYSSAFNTVVPSRLHLKLRDHLDFPAAICDWILDLLLGRKQCVKIGNTFSDSIELNTGTPQGCVLSPMLYSLFTYDCNASDLNSRVIKFADDTTVTGLITNGEESGYRNEVNRLVSWCKENNLILNISKTKELIVDFTMGPLIIDGMVVEQVNTFMDKIRQQFPEADGNYKGFSEASEIDDAMNFE